MKHYVLSWDYGYEGLGAPMAVYTNLRKLKREHPDAVPAESTVNAGKVFEGLVYHTFVAGNPIN
ncbi:hypothetical protein AAY80_252 [Stenotrophomonas phage vB_SmaS-DLP_6]|nr:hypothetical protein AAY80_252 [Stenotrophomonas phage vB_SmaS-DLP_6]